MKLAVVAIAGPIEAPYMDEWVDYHLKIGFDVFAYLNNWEYGHADSRVHLMQLPGEAQQLNAYNLFVRDFSKDYDWGLVIDCDEFFNPNGAKDAEEVFTQYECFRAVAFNWVLFGDSNLKTYDSDPVLPRFKMCQKTFNKHTKAAVHFSKTGGSVMFNNPHCTLNDCSIPNFKVSADKTSFIQGPFNQALTRISPLEYRFPYINHYFCKTFPEYKTRRAYGKADIRAEINGVKIKDKFRDDSEFGQHNFNDIENTTILNYI